MIAKRYYIRKTAYIPLVIFIIFMTYLLFSLGNFWNNKMHLFIVLVGAFIFTIIYNALISLELNDDGLVYEIKYFKKIEIRWFDIFKIEKLYQLRGTSMALKLVIHSNAGEEISISSDYANFQEIFDEINKKRTIENNEHMKKEFSQRMWAKNITLIFVVLVIGWLYLLYLKGHFYQF